ncbi:MAG TPA: hypothetical protein VGG39_05225 [Polyangiaceae bacterium]|jgi:hypothetical protein
MQRGLDQQAIEGVRTDLQGMPALYLGGKVFTPATLEQFLQARIDAANGILAARAAWLDATRQYAALDEETGQVMRDLKRLVIGAFGEQSPKLADFGFKATAATPWTPEKTALAVARRAATRAVRKTRGPKARLAITGAAPAAPATPDAPDAPDDAKE